MNESTPPPDHCAESRAQRDTLKGALAVLRHSSQEKRLRIRLDPRRLAEDYARAVGSAPERSSPYLSSKRQGLTTRPKPSTRVEELQAMALFRTKPTFSLGGDRTLKFVDYQFPLNGKAGDGFGKVDLLGITSDRHLDERIAVVELKLGTSREDRRIGLLQALIYAAVIEGNFEKIKDELERDRAAVVHRSRPDIVLLAPSEYWASLEGARTPIDANFIECVHALSRSHDFAMYLLRLHDSELRPDHEVVPLPTPSRGPDSDQQPIAFAPRFVKPPTAHPLRLENSPGVASDPSSTMNPKQAYLANLDQRMWAYVDARPALAAALVPGLSSKSGAPRFNTAPEHHNVFTSPHATPAEASAVREAIPKSERHRWYGNMRSSQALAQSVFGNLRALKRLDVLSGLIDDEGQTAFFDSAEHFTATLEYTVQHLGEPRPTSVDVMLESPSRRIAVEIKFTEAEFGTCSRARIKAGSPDYEVNGCGGNYAAQLNRSERCPLTTLGVRYWKLMPEMFDWDAAADHAPCPLRASYQLVRNVLAATARDTSSASEDNGHALVIYDARNPAFQEGGAAHRQWKTTRKALKKKAALRRVSWQRLVAHISPHEDLQWMVTELRARYGIVADA